MMVTHNEITMAISLYYASDAMGALDIVPRAQHGTAWPQRGADKITDLYSPANCCTGGWLYGWVGTLPLRVGGYPNRHQG